MARYRLIIAYDGTDFRGWARNEGVRTIQGTLESALETALRQPMPIKVAGRTDAGVHAAAQVATFDGPGDLDLLGLRRSLNALAGPEISVRFIEEVDPGFDARHAAVARSYRYTVDNRPVPDPLLRRTAWHVPDPLDVGAMEAAAGAFVGDRDFASLCRRADGGHTRRTVYSAGWTGSGVLSYTVEGRAFCHQMVRSMVALCVEVGRGKVDVGAVPGILEARDRNAAAGAAPPHGLVLVEISYPDIT